MFTGVRTSTKAMLRRHWLPILLPHHRVTDAGLSTLGGAPKSLPRALLAALSLCDATRTLADVAEAAGISPRDLIEQDHAGTVLLWPHRPWVEPRPVGPPAMGAILSPHLDDAALSMGAAMRMPGNGAP